MAKPKATRIPGRVPNDVEKPSRRAEGGDSDRGRRPISGDTRIWVASSNAILSQLCEGEVEAIEGQAASSAGGAGIVRARAMSCQPSSLRKTIWPEATRP